MYGMRGRWGIRRLPPGVGNASPQAANLRNENDPRKSHKRYHTVVLPLHYAPVESGRQESNLHLLPMKESVCMLLLLGADRSLTNPIRVRAAVRSTVAFACFATELQVAHGGI